MRSRWVVASALVVAAVVLAGCVGPARTTSSYAGKATRTANDAVSALETAALAVRTSRAGRMLGAYLNVVLTDAEGDFLSVQQSFDSIQPPDTDRADQLRHDLDELLTEGADALGQLRIAGRRGDGVQLADTAQRIPDLVASLRAFVTKASS
jgi:hypothetical protein